MAVFTQSEYKLYPWDTAKINAMVKYQPDMPIESITPNPGIELKGKSFKDLPEILNLAYHKHHIENKQFKVKTALISTGFTVKDVLPCFPQDKVVAVHKGPHSAQVKKAVKILQSAIATIDQLDGKEIIPLFPDLPCLSAKEALDALTLAYNAHPFTSLVHIKSKNIFLGRSQSGDLFTLKYSNDGKNPSQIQLANNVINFDFDDGFAGSLGKCKEFKEAFRTFKKNNYTGPLLKLPKQIVLVDVKPTDTHASQPKTSSKKPSAGSLVNYLTPSNMLGTGLLGTLCVAAFVLTSIPIAAAITAALIATVGISMYLRQSLAKRQYQSLKTAQTNQQLPKYSPQALKAFRAGVNSSYSTTDYVTGFGQVNNWRHYTAYYAGLGCANNKDTGLTHSLYTQKPQKTVKAKNA